ncbi:MAG: DUF2225 domain-containing protein [Leptospiraceae bacterium]|nr:DUF2225 domain-containing protein [Leptospiraceae bacterium]
MKDSSTQKKASFRAKENTTCPICAESHQKEQMFQGGGRLIAGKLTKELRRLYEKNKKYGRINPNDYVIAVCPKCLYACFPKDWNLSNDDLMRIKTATNERKASLEKILGPVDFYADRNLVSGAASYLLAIDCYQLRGPNLAPTPKKAVAAMKGAWYFDDLHSEFPKFNYNKVSDLLYMKATRWYLNTLDLMQSGSEPVDNAAGILGPDTDQNWGFDGVIYLNAFLTLKYRDQLAPNPEEQKEMLVKSKRILAKLYGSGKSSKSKPSALLELARESYDELNEVIDSLGGEE